MSAEKPPLENVFYHCDKCRAGVAAEMIDRFMKSGRDTPVCTCGGTMRITGEGALDRMSKTVASWKPTDTGARMSPYHFAASSVGRRANNEDAYFAVPGLYAVADGMGGHAAGEVASHIAAEHLREWAGSIARLSADGMAEQGIRTCFNACNNRLLDCMRDHPETRGMGTTLTVLAINGAVATIGHVGDSRCYLVRAGRCEQLTRDHAAGHRLLNVLGNRHDSYVGVDVQSGQIYPGDVFVLATDGMSELTEDEIARVVAASTGLGADIADALVRRALEQGASDNVTVVAVMVL